MEKTYTLLLLISFIIIFNGCGGDDNPVGPPNEPETPQATTPSTPSLISPINSSDNHPSILTLEWEEVTEANSYSLQISTNSDFSSFFLNENSIESSSKLIQRLDLEQKYYWRVKSKNEDGESDWSEIWSFTIQQLITTTENTKLLSPDVSTGITDTTAGLNKIIFNDDSEYAKNLSVDDIIMSSINDMLPNGALRKVTSINTVNGNIEVETEQAVLEEAIETADLQYEIPLSPDQVQKVVNHSKRVKALSKAKLKDGFFGTAFNKASIYKETKDGSLVGEIYMSGDIKFKPTLIIDIQKDGLDITSMKFGIRADFDSDVKIGASITKTIELEKTWQTWYLSGIMVGGIIITPQIHIVSGAEGEFTTGLEMGVGYNTSLTAGIEYVEPDFYPMSDFTQEVEFEPPTFNSTFKAKASGTGYAGVLFQGLLYGVAGPDVLLRGFVEGELVYPEQPWWSLYWGVDASSKIVLKALWKDIAKYEIGGVIGYRKKIADAYSFDPVLDWNITDTNLPSSKGVKNLSISNNGSGELEWTINSSASWLEPIPSSGSGGTEVELSYSANPTSAERNAEIIIESNGGSTEPILLTQQAKILNDQLIASYPFNGNAVDESGNGNDGNVDGATLTTDRFGTTSSAYSFDGTDDLIYGDFNWGQATSQSTLSFWFKTTNSDNLSALVGLGNSTNDHEVNGEVNKNIQGNVQFYVREREDVQRDAIYTNDSFTDGEWHHAVLVRNGSGAENLFIYIDNQLVNNITIQKDENVGDIFFDYFYIGAIYRGEGNTINRYFEGDLDDVRIYNYAISESEVSELYSEGGYTPPSNDKEIAYETDFSSDPSYQIKYSSNTDGKADIYWDNGNENFYALVKDQFDSWYSLGLSPTFNQTIDPKTTSFAISFKFNPIKPDWGHYPGIYFVKSDNSFPPNELQRSIQFTINWSDNTYKKFRLIGLGSSENYQYLSSTIPNENEWYSVKLEYDASIGRWIRYKNGISL